MSYNKLDKLLQALRNSTEKGETEWEESSWSGSFQASFPNYSVTLRKSDKFNGGEEYTISILDYHGETIEEATDEDMSEVNLKAFEEMKDLYEIARRRAKGVEQALDELLSQLDDPDIPY